MWGLQYGISALVNRHEKARSLSLHGHTLRKGHVRAHCLIKYYAAFDRVTSYIQTWMDICLKIFC